MVLILFLKKSSRIYKQLDYSTVTGIWDSSPYKWCLLMNTLDWFTFVYSMAAPAKSFVREPAK